MTYNIVGLTDEEFAATVGGTASKISEIIRRASYSTMEDRKRNRHAYPAKTIMEVQTIARFEDAAFPKQFSDYTELLYLNNPALAACQNAGMQLRVIRQCEDREVPMEAGVFVRRPLYLHESVLAARND
jgi:uncharacterized protein YozE (UPF0346 family)